MILKNKMKTLKHNGKIFVSFSNTDGILHFNYEHINNA
jgi:hypothetical protein